VNARDLSLVRLSPMVLAILLTPACGHTAIGQTAQGLVRSGNTLYGQGQYDQAVNQYDQALAESPRLDQARFNKADCFFRMDDLAKAIELYSQVAAESKDMDLVKKAKYNLGNAHFQRGLKQKDSDLQKALEDLRTSITCWRAVLDLDGTCENAKRNKEVAGLVIKDLLDQLKKQQEQKKSDPNQTQEDRSQKTEDRKKQQQGRQGQDPNQSQEDRSQKTEAGKEKQQGQGQDPNQAKDPNQNRQSETNNQQPDKNQQVAASDRTAQEILDKEQQQKKDRQMQIKTRYLPVDKDW